MKQVILIGLLFFAIVIMGASCETQETQVGNPNTQDEQPPELNLYETDDQGYSEELENSSDQETQY